MPSVKHTKLVIWERMPVDQDTTSMFTFKEVVVPTFVVKKPPLLNHSKANKESQDSSHHSLTNLPCSFLTIGWVRRCLFKPSYEKRPLSASHSSLTSSFKRGTILRRSPARVDTTMFVPTASITSIESVFLVSHGRAVKAYGFEVKAPTGQTSIRFP